MNSNTLNLILKKLFWTDSFVGMILDGIYRSITLYVQIVSCILTLLVLSVYKQFEAVRNLTLFVVYWIKTAYLILRLSIWNTEKNWIMHPRSNLKEIEKQVLV